MLETYTLMFKDKIIGELKCDGVNFSFKLNEAIVDTKYLPPILYPYDALDINYKPTSKDIKSWVEDRVVPEHRQGIEDILDKLGLNIYNAWKICKLSKAVSTDDYWWLASDGDKYEDIHPRYFIDNSLSIDFGCPLDKNDII